MLGCVLASHGSGPGGIGGGLQLSLLLLLLSCACQAYVVPYKVTRKYGYRYRNEPGYTHFRNVEIDQNTNVIYSSPRSAVIKVSHPVRKKEKRHLELHEISTHEWPSSYSSDSTCKEWGARKGCVNALHVLCLQPENLMTSDTRTVFVCGTNSFEPQCRWLNESGFTEPVDGQYMVPHSPSFTNQALWTSRDTYVYAGPVDTSNTLHSIYMWPQGRKNDWSTPGLIPSRHMLYEPTFVGAFEVGNYTYFFFTEKAFEHIHCNSHKTVPRLPRIARICSGDIGVYLPFTEDVVWASFAKATLNCTIRADGQQRLENHQLIELMDVSYEPEQGYFYALFNTRRSEMAGSAVCAFDEAALEEAFTGDYLVLDEDNKKWLSTSYPFPSKDRCAPMKQRRHMTIKDVDPMNRHQLVANQIQPVQGSPIIQTNEQRWTKLTARQIQTLNHEAKTMVFVATAGGSVKKFSATAGAGEYACLLEEFQVVEEGDEILTLKMHVKQTEDDHLVVGSVRALFSVSAARCREFKTKTECDASGDPYCGWNVGRDVCQVIVTGGKRLEQILQTPTNTCPDTTPQPVGEWYVCTHPGHSAGGAAATGSAGRQCVCRQRYCRVADTGCVPVEVANCTVINEWSEWQKVGGCDCSSNRQQWKRECLDVNNGCSGKPHKHTPCSPSDCVEEYKYGEWSDCRPLCDRSFTYRTQCSRDGLCTDVYETCSTEQAAKEWSDWRPSGRGFSGAAGGGRRGPLGRHGLERHQQTCLLYDLYQYRSNHVENIYSVLPVKDSYCRGSVEVLRSALCNTSQHEASDAGSPGWQMWSPWSPCSARCGDEIGVTKRIRFCVGSSCAQREQMEEETCRTTVACSDLRVDESRGCPEPIATAENPLSAYLITGVLCFLVGAVSSALGILVVKRCCPTSACACTNCLHHKEEGLAVKNRRNKQKRLKNINKQLSSDRREQNLYESSHTDTSTLRYMSISRLASSTRPSVSCPTPTTPTGAEQASLLSYNRDSLMRTNLSLDDL